MQTLRTEGFIMSATTKKVTLTELRASLKAITETVTESVQKVASATVAVGGELLAAQELFGQNEKLGTFKEWAVSTTGWTFDRCSAAMRAYGVAQDLPEGAGRCSIDTLAALYRLDAAGREEVYAEAVKGTGRTGKVPTTAMVKDLLAVRGAVGASGPVAGSKKKKAVPTADLVESFMSTETVTETIAKGMDSSEPLDTFLAGFAVGALAANHSPETIAAIAEAIREYVNPVEVLTETE
jgi:hypothetical protein